MAATLSGIAILSKLEHRQNAELPMLVTVAGIIMLVRLPQEANALSGIFLRLFGSSTWTTPLLSNASSSMVVTPLGITILFKWAHDANADVPILIIPSG